MVRMSESVALSHNARVDVGREWRMQGLLGGSLSPVFFSTVI